MAESKGNKKGKSEEQKPVMRPLPRPVKPVSIKRALEMTEEIEKKLREKVVGQDGAITAFTKAFQNYLIDPESRKGRPAVTCLFAGPPGVGKTYLAECIAEAVKGEYKRFDMSSYASADMSDNQIMGLIGSEETYKSARRGDLTSFAMQNEGKIFVILVDEIEKAGRPVQMLFLQILEGARLLDKFRSETADFSQAIMIFTTNCGKEMYEENEQKDLSLYTNEEISEFLRKDERSFAPELISRFSTGVMTVFNHLSPSSMETLIRGNLEKSRKGLEKAQNIRVETAAALPRILTLEAGKSDARQVSAAAKKYLTDTLLDAVRDLGRDLKVLRVLWEEKGEKEALEMIRADGEAFGEKLRKLQFSRRALCYDRNYFLQEENGALVVLTGFRIEKKVEEDASLRRLAREIGISEFERPDIRFDDVIGMATAKKKARQFIRYCDRIEDYLRMGADVPKGIILYGPPGTGKTTLAKAVAGESGARFLSTTGADILNAYDPVQRIKDVFSVAKMEAPSVIFLDEFDVVGGLRSNDRRMNSITNTLLTEMEGFKGRDPYAPVYVIAATNFGVQGDTAWLPNDYMIIDPALVRRFDQAIRIDLPDREERKAYIEMVLGKKGLEGSLNEDAVDNIAARTSGESLSFLDRLIKAAIIEAIEKGMPVSDDIIMPMIDEILFGEMRKSGSPENELTTARHEVGHLLVSYFLNNELPLYITIESRGDFGGYVQPADNSDMPQTRQRMLDMICVSLAGRAAEELFCGAITTGASSDLRKARAIAENMVCRLGMGQHFLGAFKLGELGPAAVKEIQDIIFREYERAKGILQDNEELFRHVTEELLLHKKLYTRNLESVLQGGRAEDAQPAWYVVTQGGRPGVFASHQDCIRENGEGVVYYRFGSEEEANAAFAASRFVPTDLRNKKMLYLLLTMEEFRQFADAGSACAELGFHSSTSADVRKRLENRDGGHLVYVTLRRQTAEQMGASILIGEDRYPYREGLARIDWDNVTQKDERGEERQKVRVLVEGLRLEDCLSVLTPDEETAEQVSGLLDQRGMDWIHVNVSSRYFM